MALHGKQNVDCANVSVCRPASGYRIEVRSSCVDANHFRNDAEDNASDPSGLQADQTASTSVSIQMIKVQSVGGWHLRDTCFGARDHLECKKEKADNQVHL